MQKPPLYRYLLSVISVVLVSCQLLPPATQDPPAQQTAGLNTPSAEGVAVGLSVSGEEYGVGETFEVAVEVQHVENLMGVEVHLQFDSSFVQIEDASPDVEGVQVTDGGLVRPDFVVINRSDNTNGTVDYAAAQMPPTTAVDGSGFICVLRVKALAKGSTRIAIKGVLLADQNGIEIPNILVNEALTLTIK